MDLSAFLNSGAAIGAAIAGISAALYKAIKSLFEFNDEYLRKRRFKHYAYLLSESVDHADIKQFISLAKKEDLFRVIFGKSVPSRVAVAYMELYDSQYFSLSELRATYYYSRLDDHGQLQIDPGTAGWITLIMTVVVVLYIGIFAGTAAFSLLETKELSKSIGALGIIAFYLSICWFYCRDARAILQSFNARKKLAELRRCNPAFRSKES